MAQPPKPEQTNIATPKPKAPTHFAVHCRENADGEFIVVEVAYSLDRPATERVLFTHPSAAIALREYEKETNAIKALVLHPSRFASRAAVLASAI